MYQRLGVETGVCEVQYSGPGGSAV